MFHLTLITNAFVSTINVKWNAYLRRI